MMLLHRIVVALALLGLMAFAVSAGAQNIAVIGDNATDNLLSANGYTVTLVSDAQLATPGFLSAFDALYMTRDGFSFGSGLSAAAAAEVMSYVGASGNVVALNADFADDIGDPNTDLLTLNATAFAAASGHGFIGEFNGAVSAFVANSNGFTPLGFLTGTAGPLGFGAGGSTGSVNLAPSGVGHPVLTGVALPYNPGGVEFGADIVGADPLQVLATFDNGNPAVLARGGVVQVIPEPGALAMLAGMGLSGLAALRRRKNRV